MRAWTRPAFGSPFELWREDDVLHLVLAKQAHMGLADMKELIRLVSAMDTSGRTPVLLEYPEGVEVTEDARRMLRRACREQGHPVAFFSNDHHGRAQGELFKRMHAPAFPFRVFAWHADAFRWARERRQLTVLEARP